MPDVRVIAVVGRQDAGKTLLAVQMVAYWRAQGMRVGAIKHDGHANDGVDWEKPGSDTDRLGEAGAAITVVAGGRQSLLRLHFDPHANHLDVLVRRVLAAANTSPNVSCDVIVVEGFKQSSAAKLAVLRDETDLAWLQEAGLASLVAVVAPKSLHDVVTGLCPVYDPTAVSQLCNDLWNDTRIVWNAEN